VRTDDRAVVTGIGPVTPIGIGVEDFWRGLLTGRNGARPLTHVKVDDLTVQIGAPVDVDVDAYVDPEIARRMDRVSHFAVIAADLAWADAGLEGVDPERIGVVIGSGIGGFETLERGFETYHEKGPRRVRPDLIGLMIPNAPAGAVSLMRRSVGPVECVATACASGLHAIARAVSLLDAGHADVVIAGGAEAALTRLGIAGFAAARTLSTRNDAPELASRPFDVERDGFVLAEGATALIVEKESHARARSARAYCTVTGIGLSGDAYHYVAPQPEGDGAERAMRSALRDGGLGPDDIAHVNAHATSTVSGDRAEAMALLRLFESRPVPVYAPKSSLGHMIAAAGTTEFAASALSLASGVLPATLNTQEQEADVELNVPLANADLGRGGHAVCNSFGFGGTNASVVLSHAP
jgi:3-oxoacyl-[acyl-carrier-protein] synthase II